MTPKFFLYLLANFYLNFIIYNFIFLIFFLQSKLKYIYIIYIHTHIYIINIHLIIINFIILNIFFITSNKKNYILLLLETYPYAEDRTLYISIRDRILYIIIQNTYYFLFHVYEYYIFNNTIIICAFNVLLN